MQDVITEGDQVKGTELLPVLAATSWESAVISKQTGVSQNGANPSYLERWGERPKGVAASTRSVLSHSSL